MESRKSRIMDTIMESMEGKQHQYVENEPMNIYAEPTPKKEVKETPKKVDSVKSKRKPLLTKVSDIPAAVEKVPTAKSSEVSDVRSARSASLDESAPKIMKGIDRSAGEAVERNNAAADRNLESNFDSIAAQAEGIEKQEDDRVIQEAGDKYQSLTEEYPNFWVGAAPLLAGALLGDIGEGARQGGNALINTWDRDNKIGAANKTALLKARTTASTKKDPLKPVYLPEKGRSIYLPESQIAGMEVGSPTKDLSFQQNRISQKEASDKRMGRTQETVEDALGHKWKRDKVDGSMRKMFGGMSKSQLSHVDKVRTDLKKSTSDQVESYGRLTDSLKGLRAGNTLAAKTALKEYAKHVEGGQRLSDFDVEFLQFAFGTKEKGLEAIEEFRSGNMNPRLYNELAEQIAIGLERSKKSITRKYDNAYKGSEFLDISSQDMQEILGAPSGLFNRAIININGNDVPVNMEDLGEILGQDKYKNARIVRYE